MMEFPNDKHTCHWPGCNQRVAPKFWGCRDHWFMLPKTMRDRILQLYRPGQEIDKRPSKAYLDYIRLVTAWCHGYEAGVRARQPQQERLV